jgi:membrane protein implicated in regulation of membrane protease activity
VGAVLTGVAAGLGLTASLPLLLLVFAVLSVLAWLALRRVMGVRDNQVKVWDRDINDSP